jgi:hypothetical protein
MIRRFLSLAGLGALTLLLAACGTRDYSPVGPNQAGAYGMTDYAASPPSAGAGAAREAAPSIASSEIPGLGTQAAEFKRSKARVGAFTRQRPKDPLEVVALYYNSEDGLRAMLRAPVLPRGKARFQTPRGYLEFGLASKRGGFLPGFEAGGRKFVEGESGERYALYIKNKTTSRLEVVMSVDGLDVIDRSPGSFDKRGYILDPGEKQLIQGFRYSESEIQAFRFGTVAGSLANQRYGAAGAANAGVVGFAIFPEAEYSYGSYTMGEAQRREMANPFPQNF